MFATLNHLLLRREHRPEPGAPGKQKVKICIEMQRNFESAAKRLVIQEKKGPEKIALSCNVMLASQQKQLGRSETLRRKESKPLTAEVLAPA
jgi:hypothetical protein